MPWANPENATRLLLLWKQNWMHHGFTPIVLNEYHARKHPIYEAFEKRIANLPSINPHGYDRACYLRWLAYSVAGGGLCGDYDCFTYVGPKMFGAPQGKLIGYQGHIPSLVHGTRKAMESVIKGIMDYQVSDKDLENNRPHVSDMQIFYHGGVKYTPGELVQNYGTQGWEKSDVVHFANVTVGNKPKHEIIKQLRNWE